jgi:hypothetical protein
VHRRRNQTFGELPEPFRRPHQILAYAGQSRRERVLAQLHLHHTQTHGECCKSALGAVVQIAANLIPHLPRGLLSHPGNSQA